MKISYNLRFGDTTKLIKFYENNAKNVYDEKRMNDKSIFICCYNVHGFININDEIKIQTNFQNICNILSSINADIIVLTEVCLSNVIKENHLIETFLKMGYIDHMIVKNSGCFLNKNHTDYLVVFSKLIPCPQGVPPWNVKPCS